MNTHWLRGKTVLIVGATNVVGKYLSWKLIEMYNCNVIAISENQSGLEVIEKNIEEYASNLEVHCFKPTSEKNWENFAGYLTENSKTIDILINANVDIPKFNKFENTSQKDLLSSMNSNFYSSIFSIRYMLPLLKLSREPAIVNITYALDEFGYSGSSAYEPSASALKSYTEILAEEMNNFYVTHVSIGRAKTDIYNNQNINLINGIGKKIMSADKLTDKIINGLLKKRKHIVVGTFAHINSLMDKFLPGVKKRLINRRVRNKNIKIFED